MAAGHVRQRGSSWELRAFAGRDPLTGRKVYATRTVRATGRKEAEKLLAGFVAELDDTGGTGEGGTFGELLDKWFAVNAAKWSPGNALNTRRRLDSHLLAGLKPYDVRKVSTAKLDELYSALRERGSKTAGPLKGSTVQRIHSDIRSAFELAVVYGWRRDNPAENATPAADDESEITPPSEEQVDALVAAAAELPLDSIVFLALEVETGARRGELSALRRHDRNREHGTITIARSLALGEDTPENRRRFEGHIWPTSCERGKPTALIEKPRPKTKTSRRTISISEEANELLDRYEAELVERALAAGAPFEADAFLFPADVAGERPLRPDTWSHRFARLRERAGVAVGVQFRDLRHYSVTTLLAAGVDLKTVAGRHGHGGGGKTTLAIYGHFVGGGDPDRRAAELLAARRRKPSSDHPAAAELDDSAAEGATIIPLRRRA